MSFTYVRFSAAMMCALAAACGGSELDPGAGNDPGTGTSTLRIDADLHASPIVSNAASPQSFTTELSVDVRKGDLAVTTGTVTVTSNGGTVALVYGGDNRWHGAQAGYHEVYVLDVDSGDDHVNGVRIDGPSVHAFTSPSPGALVDPHVALELTWDRDDAAQTAYLDTEQIDTIEIADTGRYTIPIGALKTKDTETEQEQIRLDRASVVIPAGAVGDSSVRVRVRNEIDLLVMPLQP